MKIGILSNSLSTAYCWNFDSVMLVGNQIGIAR